MLNTQFCDLGGLVQCWTAGSRLEGVDPQLAEAFRALPDRGGDGIAVSCRSGIPAGFACPEVAEAYALRISRGKVEVYARDDAGRRHGLHTVLALLRRDALREGTVVDYPNCPRRGIKLYLPAPDKTHEFKRLIDFAAALKYNTVMLEIGGAMEYRRHPEINAGWLEYCRFMNEYPGKAAKLQHNFRWEKNSIHSANGGGEFLSQDAVRELAGYCRGRGLTVIPEVPTLSHSDYLLTRHPELAERADDPYPDTYCPSHPDVYGLVFDVLDEVIEVFAPELINIGHDEFYTMSHCPRCRGKSAMLAYAQDVNTIARHLAGRGVRTMIWGEKLLNAYFKDGMPMGGSRKDEWPEAAASASQEAIYPAVDLIDRSVEILHWYWNIGRDLEEDFHRRGFRVTFGNFSGPAVIDWRRRRPAVDGLMVSNWGGSDWPTLQRNGILYELIYAGALLWNDRLDTADYPAIRDWCLRTLYETARAAIPEERRLELLHATDFHRPFQYFFDGHYYRESDFLLGHYRISFRDGAETLVPVVYGTNIGHDGLSPERWMDERCDGYEFDRHLAEISMATLPEFADRTRFRHSIRLPQERSQVTGVAFEPAPLLGNCRVDFEFPDTAV